MFFVNGSNILAAYAANFFLGSKILVDTKVQCMKELDIFVYNERNNFIGRKIFVNTKEKLTKELNILVGNV